MIIRQLQGRLGNRPCLFLIFALAIGATAAANAQKMSQDGAMKGSKENSTWERVE